MSQPEKILGFSTDHGLWPNGLPSEMVAVVFSHGKDSIGPVPIQKTKDQIMDDTDTITLVKALEKAQVPGRTDIWSGLGHVYLTSVDAWIPASPHILLSVGKSYKFRDRYGDEVDFVA